ncbi:MAG: SRPBCC domain-containing protein, partial [Gemmatimonadota bacterium]|nr:SRPBCC domain-containing protein [Gemmatimonadota bacterium]
PGGVWRFVMHGPDGTDYPTRIVFREIDEPNRIVYENRWDLPGSPLEFTGVNSFDVVDAKKTAFSMRMTFASVGAFETAVDRYGVLEGGTESFDRLNDYVSTMTT